MSGPSLGTRLAARGIDGTTLLVLPGIAVMVALFVYPFLYGIVDSLTPKDGVWYSNYTRFFSDRFQYGTIAATLWLALPVTILNLALALPIAFRVRLMNRQRLLTTILVLPVTLGTVFVADGLLTFLGPQGWFNRTLILVGILDAPVKLTNNYWGVFASLLITGFPFAFLLTLSYVTGIDSAANKNFLAAMEKKFGADLKTPNDLSVPEYEAVYAYKDAVEKAGTTEHGAVLKAELAEFKPNP